MDSDMRQIALRARAAGRQLALKSSTARNATLEEIARRLEQVGERLWEANRADVELARQDGLVPALLDRSTLNPARLAAMVAGCRSVAALPDPIGQTYDGATMPGGLRLSKKRVPLGVIAAIFESRPNVAVEISSLGLKSGNSIILRGGKESLRTNQVLVEVVREACLENGLPADSVQLVISTDHALVPELLAMDDLIDLVIPRGRRGLQDLVKQHAKMPVIYGGIGVCHLYVDRSADLERTIPLINNAKTQAPSVCNALDTVLVHRAVAEALIPPMIRNLNASQVKVYCDTDSMAIANAAGVVGSLVAEATDSEFGYEFLSLALSVKVVDTLDKAIEHIARYGTHHSDGILTESYANAMRFVDEVDSAAVYVNASTRYTDGGEFGLGAEVAISTQRMHARGPVGLQELTTYKWIAQGDYHVRP